AYGFGEVVNLVYQCDVVDPCAPGQGGQVGAGRRGGGEPAHRQQALVVEDDVGEVRRGVPSQGGQPAQVHQHGTVAVDDRDPAVGLGQGDAQPHGRGQAHGVL